jgi:hypothetical protein
VLAVKGVRGSRQEDKTWRSGEIRNAHHASELINFPAQGRASAVSLFAVKNAGDFQMVAPVAEEDAVVLGAKPGERRRDVGELYGAAFAGDHTSIRDGH